MDDNDYFDELDSPSLISTDKKYAGDFDMSPKNAPSMFPRSDILDPMVGSSCGIIV
jgi:hypothetical protein